MPKRARRIITAAGVGLAGAALLPTMAFAQEADPIPVTGQQLNLLFVLHRRHPRHLHAGGFRPRRNRLLPAKHAAHVVSTNFAIFALGFIAFFLVGFPLAFGGFSSARSDWALAGGGPLARFGQLGLPVGGRLGAQRRQHHDSADRLLPLHGGVHGHRGHDPDRLDGRAVEVGRLRDLGPVMLGALFYPLFAAWTWGGGWLSQIWDTMSLGAGYVDFAGSGVVHAVGGAAALAGAIVVGPRVGKFSADGGARGHPHRDAEAGSSP